MNHSAPVCCVSGVCLHAAEVCDEAEPLRGDSLPSLCLSEAKLPVTSATVTSLRACMYITVCTTQRLQILKSKQICLKSRLFFIISTEAKVFPAVKRGSLPQFE